MNTKEEKEIPRLMRFSKEPSNPKPGSHGLKSVCANSQWKGIK
jgi:hypothetical protein